MAERYPAPLVVGIVVPLVVLTLVRNNDYRFTLPLCPAPALLSVTWLGRLGPSAARAALGFPLAGACLHAAFLGWGGPGGHRRMSRTLWFPAPPPLAVHRPGVEVLEAAAAEPGGRRPLRLAAVPDHPASSRTRFGYYAAREGFPSASPAGLLAPRRSSTPSSS